MAFKQRDRSGVSNKDISKMADQLADKPYGDEKKTDDDPIVGTSITLPRSMLIWLEDEALKNKRNGVEPKSVSAILRSLVEKAM